MTGIIVNTKTRFTQDDYMEVEQAATLMRRVREQLTSTQKQLLAGCNEYDTNNFDISWDETDEDKQYELWDRLDAKLIYGQ